MFSGRNAFLATAFLVLASPAHASLKLCNRTSTILYAATSSVVSPGSTTHGWIRLDPGDCTLALSQNLKTQSTLVYAHTGLAYPGPERSWGGNFPSCVREGDFTLHQAVTQPYCTGALFAAPFAAVDSHGRADWTMTFDETPPLKSLEAAQLAGVKRLLKENGYKVGAIDGKPDRATGAALKAFRAKMAAGARAGNDQLFAALAEGAIRAGMVPDGLTVCNDVRTDLAMAMAEQRSGTLTSRGWWRVGAGACARLTAASLIGSRTWLRAELPDGKALVSGSEQFCVARQAFEIEGRKCAARAGFAPLSGQDAAGRLVRIGVKGLSS